MDDIRLDRRPVLVNGAAPCLCPFPVPRPIRQFG
jgi:hypothetical protein